MNESDEKKEPSFLLFLSRIFIFNNYIRFIYFNISDKKNLNK